MKIHYLITSLILISLFASGLFGFFGSLGEENEVAIDTTSFNETQNAMNSYLDQTTNLMNMVNTTVTDKNPFDIPYNLLMAGLAAIKVFIISPIGTFASILSEVPTYLANKFSLDLKTVSAIKAMFFIGLMAMLVYAFYKWKIED